MTKPIVIKHCWITNISNRNVCLADLAFTIPAYATVNLLDTKHYHYSIEQLEKSINSGSIFNKRNKIIVRIKPPEVPLKLNAPMQNDVFFPSRQKSILDVHEEKYEELNLSDEVFAEQNAELAEIDRRR